MIREKVRCVISTSEELGVKLQGEVLWDACYRVSSLINQFIASSRVLNLGEITQREGTSGGCQKTLNGLSPLSG